MAYEKDMFSQIGPSYLSDIDWSNLDHRRYIAASLVNGVYILAQYIPKKAQDPQALTLPRCQHFNFKLVQPLIDYHDSSYFGAIYEFNETFPCLDYTKQRPPQYVIAFRGTLLKPENIVQDLKLDFNCMTNTLKHRKRFEIGLESTQNLISQVKSGNVWLAGHSLGSSIALLIGRHIVQNTGFRLETYLFNPPFISAPIEMIKDEKVKFGLRIAKSVMTAGLAGAKHGGSHSKAEENNDPFIMLSSWIPYLFINSSDPICSEYVGYFKHREKMEKIGAGKIEKLATKSSEAAHLIPSANLSINCSSCNNYKEAHGIKYYIDAAHGIKKCFEAAHGINQWLKLDLELKYKLYQYK